MKDLSSITATELFTKWWDERWIRGIVLMLIPIGIIDTVFTISIAQLYGIEAEFNPITRFFLSSSFWFLWPILNISGFMFFCMMAGSYYLHSRLKLGGPDTSWISVIIALRVAMVGYNVTFYYLPFVITVYPPFWAAFISFVMTFFLMNNLLKRQNDISWEQTKYTITSKYINYRDSKLISSAGIPEQDKEDTSSIKEDLKKEVLSGIPKKNQPLWKNPWVKRVVYLSSAAFSFVLMGMAIEFISNISGLSTWNDQRGAYFVLNEITGPPVMASFIAILFFMGLSLFFILRAFSTTQEIDLD
ncbi:MAG: hypothetical protein JW779_06160 [Candidatus Thorarchaeota archaeon]|nr:hypothetical protein [Candidatus Thorarchaeota archaeon]